ncbi:DOK2 protein, partial [Rhipidura dahli]|nr:DOK2 protein [Rhipidura dahli]
GLEQAFEVTVRATPSSQRCRLRGRCVLRAGSEALELRQFQSQELLYSWPYRFLRRFGRDKVTFSFEAGRRCASGEGNFEFDTRQGNEIFQAIEAAIELQRGRGAEDEAPRPPDPSWTPSRAQSHEEPKCPSGEGKGVKTKAGMPPGAGEPSGASQASRGVDFPYSEPCDSLRRGKAPEKRCWRPGGAGVEPEYAVPFDTIAKSFLPRQLGALGCPQEGLPEPPSGTGEAERAQQQQPPGRPAAPKPEHIYDEPEALCALSVYDEPEEVKGEAWRMQAAPEEPPGLSCPYNPQRDDYAVPKKPVRLRQPLVLQGKEWLGDSEYDNVALKGAKK